VRADESFVSAAERECEEETGIPLTGQLYFVDSYTLLNEKGEPTGRTGIHFAFAADSDTVCSDEFPEYRWVTSLEEMQELQPRIAGIDNHAAYSASRLSYSRLLSHALDLLEQSDQQPADMPVLRDALAKLTWSSREEAHLSSPAYLNQ
jgi:8-oxo-dGTP pyrophosphatase MutT (NUDIX family)